MKLTYQETDWVSSKLNSYDIKFQEIYDELKDHLLTAIENLRNNGDNRHVEILFKEVVSTQFPGFWPFEDIVKEYQMAYKKRIRAAVWANFKYYLNWQTLPLLGLMVVAGFFIPHNKATVITMMVILLLAAAVPTLYSYINGRKIKTDKGKQSLVKNYVNQQSNFLVLIINLMFNLFGSLGRNWAPVAFLSPVHYAPVIFMLFIGFFFIYGMGCIRLARQEFKIN